MMNADLLKVWGRAGPVTVNNLNDFVQHIEQFMKPRASPKVEVNRFLFRGTSNTAYDLLPSLPRSVGSRTPKGRPWLSAELLYHIEEQSTKQFQSKVRLYMDTAFIPDEGDIVAWWQLMQHHHAKTRVLDWTASPFVAAYFAVAANPEADGAVWMVDHGAHGNRMEDLYSNQFVERDGTRVRKFELLTPLPYKRIEGDPDKEIVTDILEKSETQAAAIYRDETERLSASLYFVPCTLPNRRMSAQRGWFSCASAIEVDHGAAIAMAFSDPKHADRWWCQRLVIDRKAKSRILRDLWRMNITGETIFCGLDGLGMAMGELIDLLNPDDCIYKLENGLLSVRSHLGGDPGGDGTSATPPLIDPQFLLKPC